MLGLCLRNCVVRVVLFWGVVLCVGFVVLELCCVGDVLSGDNLVWGCV